MNNSRVCCECGKRKPIDGYYRHPNGRAGHASVCKVCKRTYQRAAYALKAPIERVKARVRYQTDAEYRRRRMESAARYSHTPQGRESRRLTNRAYRAYRRAIGAPPFPSARPESIAARRARCEQQRVQEASAS
ncbi:MAG: hypothetical protein LBF16_09840 [Pseudomonadales bacterium]|jgi:hypothetical protein|nr:hypothetical protein [Pseudomonadales bacterium]